jgi:hypothetical protein
MTVYQPQILELNFQETHTKVHKMRGLIYMRM